MPVGLQVPELRIVAGDDDTILNLDSLQGLWTEEQYLRATDHSRRLLEFTDGYLEVLPRPTDKHQVISQFLLLAFLPFIGRLGGRVLYAPVRVQIREGKYREPDLLLGAAGKRAYACMADRTHIHRVGGCNARQDTPQRPGCLSGRYR